MKFRHLVVSLLLLAGVAAAQTTTGSVTGTVTDATGAVVPKASVQLTNVDTNAAITQTCNEAGQYVFPNVAPGNYRVTVKMNGFRNESVSGIIVEVNRATPVNVALEVGATDTTVDVTAKATVQLQTADSQIGNALSTDSILRLPTLQRNATELMNLQPGVVVGGNGLNFRVTGAIDDQNTVTLDGLDITQSVVAGNTVVPTPADSVEEFRVAVANPMANLDRGSGGQITLVGRHGTNQLHGSLYEYLQNSKLNSNTWENNFNGISKATIRDNRFGTSLGGPIQKNKTFIFGNYEGRRFASASQVNRTVPSDLLKQGIVQFRDGNGNIQQYNLATAAICGPSGNSPCDPRGLGISPAVKAQLALMPASNTTGGDGLNTLGYLAIIPTPVQTDYGVLRLDHTFSDRMTFNGNYTYFRNITTGSGDIEILNGKAQSVVSNPQRGMVLSGSLNYQFTPTLFNVVRFGYVRDTNANQATSPTQAAGILNVPGSNTAAGPVGLLIGSGVSSFLDSPIDMDTQRARYQANYNGDWQWIDDVTKIWGKHTSQFGMQLNMLPYTHVRADKVLGSIASLVATVDGDQGFISIPASERPPTCGAGVSTNCITSANLTNWDRYYASVLGMVDNVGVLAARDKNLQPLPLGTFLINHTNEWASYFYFQDSWRITNSLTLTYGLSYGWQTSPTEQNNLQTIMIDAGTNQPIDAVTYLQNKLSAAQSGQIYNPTVGFATVSAAKRPVYNVDWGDIAPRAAFAWNPSRTSGLLGTLLGERKTVIRGGFSEVYDRSNTVQSVEIPMLGVGFDQNISINGPLCNATGAGGTGCNAGAGSNTPGLSSFRVGVDGTLPLPVPTAVTSPVIPASPYSEALSFQVDPNTKVGRSYNVDFSIQRELPGGVLIEGAYVGRFARHLPQAVNLSSSPYMFVDTASGQSFAQAFDNIATALRAGQTAPAQPWFENQLPGLAKLQGTATATAYVVSRLSSSFVNGNVSTIFQNLGTYRRSLGLLPYNNDQAQMEFMRTYIGQSNYNGAIISVAKRFSRGLTINANYTYAKTLDDNLSNQNNAGYYGNSLHPGVDYGPSSYDRRHVFNAFYVYDLPAGKNHRFRTGTAFDKVIEGWYTSGIVQAWTGTPLTVTESGQVFGGGLILAPNTAAIPTGPIPSTGVNGGIAPTTGCGTNGSGIHGTGLNIFGNPAAVCAEFRPLLLSTDTRTGRANPMRGLPFKNMDMRFGKRTTIREGLSTEFSADFFNAFNHPNFSTPSLSLTNPAAFGVITGTVTPANRTNSARWIELGLRVQF